MEENDKMVGDTRKKRQYKPKALNEIFEHGKVPPQATDLEEAVLGAIMLEKDALASIIDVIRPDAFYKEAHQIIFMAITRLFAKGEPIDILTVTNELKFTGELESAGGPFYIAQLTNRVASASNTEFHARIILQKFIQRELIRISSEIIHDAYEDTTDVFQLLDKAENQLFSVGETNMRRNYLDMQSLVRDAVKRIENAKNQTGQFSGVPSGFTELDRVTAGWQPSDLIIVAARPGMGKTAFVLTMARNVAVDFKKAVAVFSLEMSSVQLVTRLISAEAQLPGDKLRKGNLENYEWEQLNAKISALIDAPLYIDDTPSLSVFELRAKCRRLKAQHDIQMVVIDYIQLMSAGIDRSSGNREQEISTISRSLKSLAKELNIPVIALSQLNRSVEQRPNKKPLLSDLRESGAIEQDADMVVFIYRPEYYNQNVDEGGASLAGHAEISIAKHRNGALKDVPLRFISKYAKFTDPEPGDFDISGALAPNGKFENGINTLTIQSKMNDMDEDHEPPY
ncbi:Replicative DNA helicase [bioreactor metagenome]|jgi:replicative DNA helicase|uniref:DNA 5'-3' helicase n=1 Tax=bioreactor metagenome TaxID=1076179 RepID=A0A644TQ79_9ZZZZ|nr:replicative DNA helicase [Lentimicrobium sp.]MEA5108866.1 replicative DNA helicase [Lentimicrobium sp.]